MIAGRDGIIAGIVGHRNQPRVAGAPVFRPGFERLREVGNVFLGDDLFQFLFLSEGTIPPNAQLHQVFAVIVGRIPQIVVRHLHHLFIAQVRIGRNTFVAQAPLDGVFVIGTIGFRSHVPAPEFGFGAQEQGFAHLKQGDIAYSEIIRIHGREHEVGIAAIFLGVYTGARTYPHIHIGSSISGSNAFHVIEFVEKPSVEIAQKYVESTKYYWNSGMFIWKTETIVNEIEYLMPELARITKKISKIIGTPKYEVELPALWSEITPQTIDYGVMEKARKVAVLPAPNLGWSDIGSWDSLAELLPGDADENRILADQVLIHQSHNCLIKQDGSLRLITIAGLDDIVIVDTKDVLLVCKRNETQVVRKIVDILKDNQLTKYL